jgi:hypothetical protein
MTPELQEKIQEIIEIMEAGETPQFVYRAALKDEPRLAEKVRQGKTRVFYMSPLEALILNRMFLSPFYSLMVEQSDAFHTSVGINMHSEPIKVVEAMCDTDEKCEPECADDFHIMEFDYSGYDQSIPFDMKHAACTVLWKVLKELGYSETQLNIVRSLMTANLFIFVEMNKDLFMKAGLQPSGKYATAEDNSLVGVLLLMYAWYHVTDDDFFQHVNPVTYGDDALVRVACKHRHIFNNIVYKQLCEDLYNMKITPAVKDGSFSRFVSVNTMSFLKRKFVWSEKANTYVAPLDLDSCYKALEWRIPSTAVTAEEQLVAPVNL